MKWGVILALVLGLFLAGFASAEFTIIYDSYDNFNDVLLSPVAGNGTEASIQKVIVNFDDKNVSVESNLSLFSSNFGKDIRVSLDDNYFAEIGILPDAALELAAFEGIDCEVSECTVELKEVEEEDYISYSYEVNSKKTVKIFGLFESNMSIRAEVDAFTGDTLIHEPAWSFLGVEDTSLRPAPKVKPVKAGCQLIGSTGVKINGVIKKNTALRCADKTSQTVYYCKDDNTLDTQPKSCNPGYECKNNKCAKVKMTAISIAQEAASKCKPTKNGVKVGNKPYKDSCSSVYVLIKYRCENDKAVPKPEEVKRLDLYCVKGKWIKHTGNPPTCIEFQNDGVLDGEGRKKSKCEGGKLMNYNCVAGKAHSYSADCMPGEYCKDGENKCTKAEDGGNGEETGGPGDGTGGGTGAGTMTTLKLESNPAGARINVWAKDPNVPFYSGATPYTNAALPAGQYDVVFSLNGKNLANDANSPFVLNAGKTLTLTADFTTGTITASETAGTVETPPVSGPQPLSESNIPWTPGFHLFKTPIDTDQGGLFGTLRLHGYFVDKDGTKCWSVTSFNNFGLDKVYDGKPVSLTKADLVNALNSGSMSLGGKVIKLDPKKTGAFNNNEIRGFGNSVKVGEVIVEEEPVVPYDSTFKKNLPGAVSNGRLEAKLGLDGGTLKVLP